jgi:hypothetical protein
MTKYAALYRKYIEGKSKITRYDIKKNKFYLLKQYINIDNKKINYSEAEAPILFVLFVSKKNDLVHAVKVNEVSPTSIKKLFSKFIDKDTHDLQFDNNAKKMYESYLKKIPTVTNETYRTYKWSGMVSVFDLSIDEEAVIPKKYLKHKK